jgi:hypothetical protein
VPGINGVSWKNLKPSTPGRLLAWIAVPVLGVLACGLLLATSVGGVRGGLGQIGTQQEPQVVAASRLAFDLESMDGHVADILLIGNAAGLGESQSDAYQKFENYQSDADTQLELLGSGINAIPYGPATYVSIENQLSQYTQYAAYAMYIDVQAHGQKAGQPPAAALQAYDHAATLMNESGSGILAQAQVLYTAEQLAESAPINAGSGTIWHLQLACGLLLAFIVIRLLIAQRRLSRAFRRTVNPLLALTTVGALIFGVLLFSALGDAKSAYGAQDLTGPGSVATLWQARATAADMHAAESRWLLQAGNPTAQRATATAAEQQTFATGQKWITSVPILSGDVMPELNTYLDDDAQLTNSLLNGGTSDARLLAAVGYDTGPSDAAYAKFDAGLTQIIGVDQQAFAAATVKGENGLVTWLWLPWLWMLATIALIVFGFAPRLREYR